MASDENPFHSEIPGIDLKGEERFSGKVLADWAFDGEHILSNVLLEVSEGEITTLQSEVDVDYLNSKKLLRVSAILPGFFNAHCHLDLSGINALGGMDDFKYEFTDGFTEWLEIVRGYRPQESPKELKNAVRLGLSQLAQSGTTGIVDFSADAISLSELESSAFNGIILKELIGWSSPRDREAINSARDWIEANSKNLPAHIQLGLAPHAPYSTSKFLLEESVSQFPNYLQSIHLCEDPGERELLERGEGPFKEFLNRLGLEVRLDQIPQESPVEYLDRLGLLTPRTLLVHCNDLNERDLDLIADSGANIVFCPNTHFYFDRPAHPLPMILDRGIPVGLGTDSSASISGGLLSMYEELHQVRNFFPDIDPKILFKLSVGGLLGEYWRPPHCLKVGQIANISLWHHTDDKPSDFISLPAYCFLTVSQGRCLYKHPDITD